VKIVEELEPMEGPSASRTEEGEGPDNGGSPEEDVKVGAVKTVKAVRKNPAEKEAPGGNEAPTVDEPKDIEKQGSKTPLKKKPVSVNQDPDDIPMEVVKPKDENKDKDGTKPNGQFSLDW